MGINNTNVVNENFIEGQISPDKSFVDAPTGSVQPTQSDPTEAWSPRNETKVDEAKAFAIRLWNIVGIVVFSVVVGIVLYYIGNVIKPLGVLEGTITNYIKNTDDKIEKIQEDIEELQGECFRSGVPSSKE